VRTGLIGRPYVLDALDALKAQRIQCGFAVEAGSLLLMST
jgi:hypothetical protein